VSNFNLINVAVIVSSQDGDYASQGYLDPEISDKGGHANSASYCAVFELHP